jgi:hypothetical protein
MRDGRHDRLLDAMILLCAVGAMIRLYRARRAWWPHPTAEESAQIDDTLEDSFPASDPPSWTATTAGTATSSRA